MGEKIAFYEDPYMMKGIGKPMKLQNLEIQELNDQLFDELSESCDTTIQREENYFKFIFKDDES